jgi:acyl carrier protein
MRSIDEIEQKLSLLIEDATLGAVKAEAVRSDQALLEDLGLDSLDYATTMLGCEEWLGVKIDESTVEWREVRTVRQLADLLNRSQRAG